MVGGSDTRELANQRRELGRARTRVAIGMMLGGQTAKSAAHRGGVGVRRHAEQARRCGTRRSLISPGISAVGAAAGSLATLSGARARLRPCKKSRGVSTTRRAAAGTRGPNVETNHAVREPEQGVEPRPELKAQRREAKASLASFSLTRISPPGAALGREREHAASRACCDRAPPRAQAAGPGDGSPCPVSTPSTRPAVMNTR